MRNAIRRGALLGSFGAPLILCVLAGVLPVAQGERAEKAGAKQAVTFPLPLPGVIGVEKFEGLLDRFLNEGGYLSWTRDREFRATGPFIDGKTYGVHPA